MMHAWKQQLTITVNKNEITNKKNLFCTIIVTLENEMFSVMLHFKL